MTHREKLVRAGLIPRATPRPISSVAQDIPDVLRCLFDSLPERPDEQLAITITYDAPGATVILTYGDKTGIGRADGMNLAEACYTAVVEVLGL